MIILLKWKKSVLLLLQISYIHYYLEAFSTRNKRMTVSNLAKAVENIDSFGNMFEKGLTENKDDFVK